MDRQLGTEGSPGRVQGTPGQGREGGSREPEAVQATHQTSAEGSVVSWLGPLVWGRGGQQYWYKALGRRIQAEGVRHNMLNIHGGLQGGMV